MTRGERVYGVTGVTGVTGVRGVTRMTGMTAVTGVTRVMGVMRVKMGVRSNGADKTDVTGGKLEEMKLDTEKCYYGGTTTTTSRKDILIGLLSQWALEG